ncbi:unnamed protein product [Arabidopsis thaliana]|uniref:(thale cress) hypothetical protein n=1 Tax=Arabidopsis thaliana TaxID=3702 RepID=A0A7G2F1X5_ARATH|nr:unnamed protein product [Arabidopsis thaliana]
MAQPPNPYAALTPTEAESSGPFEPETLLPLINRALPLAQALPSQSPLVAVGRGSSGRTFLGVNVELPGLSPLHSIHAGQFLVVHLALNNERTLNCLAFSSNGSYFDPPCPHCCQLLQEIRNASSTKLLITDPSRQRDMSLSTYLPQKYFSLYNEVPKYFFARLLDENRNNGLTLINPNPIRDCLDSEICNHLGCRALKAANRSYAPYSKSPSGVALMDFQGRVYSGWSIESVANPILGAAQAALVDFMTNGGGHEFNNIVRGFLVEKRDAKFCALMTYHITAEAVDPSNDSRFTFQTRVTRATCQKDEDLRILTEVCTGDKTKRWNDEAIDGFYKGYLPKWISDDILMPCRDMRLESVPLQIMKVIVETREAVESNEKLMAGNAIFYISFKYLNAPHGPPQYHRAIVRRTVDGIPGHVSLELKCWLHDL